MTNYTVTITLNPAIPDTRVRARLSNLVETEGNALVGVPLVISFNGQPDGLTLDRVQYFNGTIWVTTVAADMTGTPFLLLDSTHDDGISFVGYKANKA